MLLNCLFNKQLSSKPLFRHKPLKQQEGTSKQDNQHLEKSRGCSLSFTTCTANIPLAEQTRTGSTADFVRKQRAPKINFRTLGTLFSNIQKSNLFSIHLPSASQMDPLHDIHRSLSKTPPLQQHLSTSPFFIVLAGSPLYVQMRNRDTAGSRMGFLERT